MLRLVGGRGSATSTRVIHDVTNAGAAAEPRLRAAAPSSAVRRWK